MKLESIIDITEKKQRESAVKSALKSLVSQTEFEKVETEVKEVIVKYGRITEVEGGRVWIDFEGNPMKSEVMAEFDCSDITIQEVKELLEIIEVVKIEFKDTALKKPVVKDIYFSVSMVKYFKYI